MADLRAGQTVSQLWFFGDLALTKHCCQRRRRACVCVCGGGVRCWWAHMEAFEQSRRRLLWLLYTLHLCSTSSTQWETETVVCDCWPPFRRVRSLGGGGRRRSGKQQAKLKTKQNNKNGIEMVAGVLGNLHKAKPQNFSWCMMFDQTEKCRKTPACEEARFKTGLFSESSRKKCL